MMEEEHEGGHENSERWLLTYADMITLLLVFFIILYALGRVDVVKFQQFSNSAGVAMGNKYIVGESPGKSFVDLNAGASREQSQMQDIKNKVQQKIDKNGLQGVVHIFLDERGLTIRVEEGLFFASGSDVLNPNAKNVIAMITSTLNELPDNYVRVEGHTDNVPIKTAKFPSNWELSASRATNVVKQMILSGFNPKYLSSAGYGEYRPIADNSTPAGKQANRRVDIVLLKTGMSKGEPGAKSKANLDEAGNASTQDAGTAQDNGQIRYTNADF